MTKHSRSGSLFLLTENEAPQDARYSRLESIEVRPLVPKGIFALGQLPDKWEVIHTIPYGDFHSPVPFLAHPRLKPFHVGHKSVVLSQSQQALCS